MGYFLFGMAKLTAKKEEHGENNKNVTIIVGILVLILFNVMRQTGDLRLHQWIWQRLDIISEWRYVGGEADHFLKMGRGQYNRTQPMEKRESALWISMVGK